MAFTYDDIATALADFVAAPEADYRVGDKEFRNSQKPKQLLEMMKLEFSAPLGDIETVSIDIGEVDGFGIDRSQRAVPN